jgi:hypothetical protein
MWPFKKKNKKEESEKPVSKSQTARIMAQTTSGLSGIPVQTYNRPINTYHETTRETVVVRDNSNDALTGFLVADALSGGCPESELIGAAIGGVTGGIIGAELASCNNDSLPDYHNESQLPDTPPLDTSSCYDSSSSSDYSSSSSYDSSSSCDTSNFSDSSSSSSSDF